MKVEIEKTPEPEEVDMDFRGLATDIDGDLWLFTNEGYILIHEDGSFVIYDVEMFNENTYYCCSPFTKYNGKVTLSND